MNQRITPDPQSFEQFLAAASLLQQIQEEALRHSSGESRQPLLELFEIQRAVETGKQDFRVIVQRIVALVRRVVGASGTGVWFFTRQEFAYFAAAGGVSDDERLRLQILSKLAAFQLGDTSLPTITPLQRGARDAGHYPASIKSLLVAPIYHGQKVVGVLAAFSPEFDAFTERDAENVRFLAGLLALALDKAVEAGLRENAELEWAAMLQLIEKMTPSVQKPLANEEQIHHRSPYGLPRVPIAEPDPRPAPLSPQIPRLCETQSETLASENFESSSEKGSGPAEAAQPLGSSSVNWPAIPRAFFHWHMRRAQFLVLRLQESSQGLVRHVSRYQPKLRAASKWMKDVAPRLAQLTVLFWESSQRLVCHVSRCQPRLRAASERMKEFAFWPAHSGLWSNVKNARNKWLRYCRRDRWAALYVAGAWAAVLITLVSFLAMEIRMHKPSQSEARDSINTPEGSPASASSGVARSSSDSTPLGTLASKPLPLKSERRVAGRPLQLSHLQITDRDTDAELRNMTRHEIARLRDGAHYGDDIAAFDLGMAYEIGYDVPQNCAQAANWVTESAKQGNPAAEYNLGLRYRDGDGVTANAEEAERWLRKAAAQKYSDAQLALEALTSH
jgi:hypothetical protein